MKQIPQLLYIHANRHSLYPVILKGYPDYEQFWPCQNYFSSNSKFSAISKMAV